MKKKEFLLLLTLLLALSSSSWPSNIFVFSLSLTRRTFFFCLMKKQKEIFSFNKTFLLNYRALNLMSSKSNPSKGGSAESGNIKTASSNRATESIGEEELLKRTTPITVNDVLRLSKPTQSKAYLFFFSNLSHDFASVHCHHFRLSHQNRWEHL